jgi:hypothetical protein
MSWEEALFWFCVVIYAVPLCVGIAGMLIDAAIALAWRWCRGFA